MATVAADTDKYEVQEIIGMYTYRFPRSATNKHQVAALLV